MKQDIEVRPNSVAVLGFHEGNAGQVETWFEEVTGFHIACFVHESAEPLNIDAAAENKKRVTKRMEYPTKDSFKGRPLIVSTRWAAELKKLGIRKILPLTSNDRDRHKQVNVCLENGFELVSAIHPSAVILSGATIAPGVWINARSVIGYKAEISSGVMINTGVIIEHHNVLEQGPAVGFLYPWLDASGGCGRFVNRFVLCESGVVWRVRVWCVVRFRRGSVCAAGCAARVALFMTGARFACLDGQDVRWIAQVAKFLLTCLHSAVHDSRGSSRREPTVF